MPVSPHLNYLILENQVKARTFLDVASVAVGIAGVAFGVWQMQQSNKAQAQLLEAQAEAQVAAEDLTGVLGTVLEAYESGAANPADVDFEVLRTQINSVLETVYDAQGTDLKDQFKLITSRIPVKIGDAVVVETPGGQRVTMGVRAIRETDRDGIAVIAGFRGAQNFFTMGAQDRWRADGEECTISLAGVSPTESPDTAEFFLDCG